MKDISIDVDPTSPAALLVQATAKKSESLKQALTAADLSKVIQEEEGTAKDDNINTKDQNTYKK